MLNKLRQWYYAPIFEGDEEANRQAQLLNLITVSGAVVAFLMAPTLAILGESQPWFYIIDAAIFGGFIFLQIMLRRGWIKRTAGVIVGFTYAGVTAINFLHGSVRDPSIAMYILVVILAGQFFYWRGVFSSATITVATILALGFAESTGLLIRSELFISSLEWISYSVILLLISFLSIYNAQLIRFSLQRARREIENREIAEMELKKLTRAIEQSPESIVITDMDGNIEYVNPSFTQVSGYSLDEVRGKNPRVLKTDQTPTGTHEQLWKNLTTGKEWRGEFVNKRKDGSFYTESAIISPIIGPDGLPTHYLAVKQDITRQKEVEAALRRTTDLYKLVSENISDVIWVVDLTDGKYIYISPSVERLRGYTVEEMLAQKMDEALAPDYKESVQKKLADRIMSFKDGQKSHYSDEIAETCKDGSIVWTETTTFFRTNDSNGHLEAYGVSRDITERKWNQDLVQVRLELLELAVDTSLDDFLETALDKIAEFAGSTIAFYHFVEPDQKTLCLQAWSARTMREFCKAEGKGLHYDIDTAGVWVDCVRQRRPIIHNDYCSLPERKGLPPGHAPVLRELVVPVYRSDKVVSILGVGNKPTDYGEKDIEAVSYLADVVWEVSKRKQAEQNLSEAQSRLSLLSQNLEDVGLVIYSRDKEDESKFEYLSQSMEGITGVKVEDAMRDAGTLTRNVLPEYLLKIRSMLKKSAETLEKFRIEVRQKHGITGEIRWLLLTFTPRRRTDGTVVWYGVQMDITDRKRNEQAIEDANNRLREDMHKIEHLQDELRDLTIRDPLTGLYNRRYLSEMLPREVTRARRETSPLSFVMADIDLFKKINDTYGHQVGDNFLVEIARLMAANARSSDILCRYGGEEFLMILPGARSGDAARRMDDLREKIANLAIRRDGYNLKVTMSFGVASFPDHGEDAGQVIDRSDNALYQSKMAGRNRVTIWQARPESVSQPDV